MLYKNYKKDIIKNVKQCEKNKTELNCIFNFYLMMGNGI